MTSIADLPAPTLGAEPRQDAGGHALSACPRLLHFEQGNLLTDVRQSFASCPENLHRSQTLAAALGFLGPPTPPPPLKTTS